MQRKIAGGIVRARIVILIGMVILFILCLTTISKTRINYDLTRYLSADTMTRRALDVMEEEFGSSEQLRVMFQNLPEDQLRSAFDALNGLPEVQAAVHDGSKDVRQSGGVTYQLITLTLRECDSAKLVEKLRGMFPEAGPYAVGGSAAALLDVQESVAEEIPVVMLISVAVVLIVLLLTSHAWLEPAVILIVLALSIVINMGTNFIFPDVSFITFAVCAILQLALSIDYAIMLLHTYNGYCGEGMRPRDAMTEALAQSFMPVSSSAFTTVAGLLSLLFMSFTIGFDIGLVLSKGILISMLSVFLLMPSVTLLFEKALRRTRHKPLRLGGEHLARGVYKGRRIVAVLLLAAVISGAYLQSENTYLFTDAGQGEQQTESHEIDRIFGASNPMVLLVPGGDEDQDYDAQRALVDRLLSVTVNGDKAVGGVSAMVTTGAEALKYYTAQDVAAMTGMSPLLINLFFAAQGFGASVRADRLLLAAGSLAAGNEQIQSLQSTLALAKETFNGPRYARMLLEMNFPVGDPRTRQAIDQFLAAARAAYGDRAYLTGAAMSTYDIANAFEGDLMKVNLITFLAILLIVAISFRSLPLPLMLVLVIEGAIWITMAVSRVLNQPIFFMSYLICVSIQMGATIDYGILLSSQYRGLRASLPPREALMAAMKKALPTILTSGAILITAGYIIGKLCSVYYISAIGALLARGALISVLLILTLLPALLAILDRFVTRGQGAARAVRR